MSQQPVCGSCPAFLSDPESLALGRCFGCRSGPPQMRVESSPSGKPVPTELESLRAERDILKAAIQKHHDQYADDRCFIDDVELYAAAGLAPADVRVGDKFAMLKNCVRFVEQRCESGGPWKSYADLETERDAIKAQAEMLRVENTRLNEQHEQSKSRWWELSNENEKLVAENERLKDELQGEIRAHAAHHQYENAAVTERDQLRTLAEQLAKALNEAIFELGRVNRFAVTEEMEAALAVYAPMEGKS